MTTLSDFIRISDLYDLPGTFEAFDETFCSFSVRMVWHEFNEHQVDSEKFYATLKFDRRFRVKVLLASDDRSTVYCLKFDGEYFAVISTQRNEEYADRYITNAAIFKNAISYLASVYFGLQCYEDTVDSEQKFYPESLGLDAESLPNIAKPAVFEDAILLANGRGSQRLLSTVDRDLYLLFVKTERMDQVPMYVRRGPCVFKKIRVLTAPEIAADNELMASMNEADGTITIAFQQLDGEIIEGVPKV